MHIQIEVPEYDDGYELHLPSCDDEDDSGAGSGEGGCADDEKYNGFVTSDPVINLDPARCSVNEIPTAQEPKGFVPLIGSEVDVRDARSPIPSTSSKTNGTVLNM